MVLRCLRLSIGLFCTEAGSALLASAQKHFVRFSAQPNNQRLDYIRLNRLDPRPLPRRAEGWWEVLER